MQYLLMVHIDENAWPKMPPAEREQRVAAYAAYTEALKASGAWRGSGRLQPSTAATTVRAANGKTQVLDGPYADLKEQLGGFFMIDVADLDAALSWASRCPTVHHGVVEVRPVWVAGS